MRSIITTEGLKVRAALPSRHLRKLNEAGLGRDEAVQHLVHFLEHCKVVRVMLGETIANNCESSMTQFMTEKLVEPMCFFTTGFLNGFFSALKGQHVKETKCIAVGDPYCEWEFRWS